MEGSRISKQNSKSNADHLRERMLLIIDYLDRVEDFCGNDFRRFIEENRSNTRVLALLSREVENMTAHLKGPQREELDALLKARLHIDRGRERAKAEEWIDSVLRRGKIRSEKERRHVEEYLERIIASGGDPSRIGAINALLDAS